jgi:hypothetical protein
MRPVLLALAAVALTAESAPSPVPLPIDVQVQQFEQALNESRLTEAATVLDKLIAQRTPGDGKPRPDPLLNALFGRFYLAANESAPAAIYLDRAPIPELPPSLRAATALDHGRALGLRGDRAAALQAYREAAAAAGTDGERRRAALGLATQSLADNPSGVRSDLASISGGALTPERWRANFLRAASASLTGNAQEAQRFADQA